MNIVYSASDLYSSLAGISLTSLLINNTDVEDIQIFIMDNGIGEENKLKLERTALKFNRNIHFVPLADSLSKVNINIQKWNISTFGRLFEASSLPELDKVIHIDCDTIVNGPIKYLWEIDMEHSVVAGAPDCLSDLYKSNIGLKPDDTYINAGIVVLNLKRIRDLNLEEVFLDYIEKNSKMLTYVDQEVINACVPQCEKIELSLKYNSYSILHYVKFRQLKRLRHAQHIFPEECFNEAVNSPIFLHFTGCFLEGTRPWIEGDKHPKKNLYTKYKLQSEWVGMPDWKDDRSFKSKFASVIARIIPKCILTSVVGYIHGVYTPRKNKRLQEKNKYGNAIIKN